MKRLILIAIIAFAACKKDNGEPGNPGNTGNNQPDNTNTPPPPAPKLDSTFDLDASQAPKFVAHNYIEVDSIAKVSKFRSGMGHDYTDDFESCRSMKHYFLPSAADWSKVRIFSPVRGTVNVVFSEWAGSQIHIQSRDHPAFTFILFHVNLNAPLKVGDTLSAGQWIGNHVGNQTMSDIAVAVQTSIDGPNDNTNRWKGMRLMSVFHVMTDSVFNTFGVASRDSFQISAAARDASPLECNGEAFLNAGQLENWVSVN
jgi:hypothetical protein